MNATLPAGIEAYLKEAGFSATEMIILRKLVEEDALTLRELAAKTGKSTGVLDQAMKKLLSKNIAEKRLINDQPKYSIHSLDAIVTWVQRDMHQRKEMLDRKHQNFEQFIASLKVDKQRPDMQYFQGLPGIQQAYAALLESNNELLTTTPVLTTAEDDPLRDFKVAYFRKRQVRKIFQRVLAPDSPLARRFQSRDAFEYRKTLLLPPEECPMDFEKTVVGDTLACIDMRHESACFIKFPGLAQAERANFEMQWARQLQREREERHEADEAPEPPSIPLKTRLFSSFREFLLSRRSVVAFIAFALISGALTFGLYKANRDLNVERIRHEVMAIAATGALQFDANDIHAIKRPDDIAKPQYAKLVATLNLIRRSNPHIRFSYIMRKTSDPLTLEFVADADSLRPSDSKDLNNDGVLDASDALSYPGDTYDIRSFPDMASGFQRPYADTTLVTDQWGSFISGAAPIVDSSGHAVAIVGVDMLAENLDRLSSETFKPLFFFVLLLFLFVLARFYSLNRSLLHECWAMCLENKVRVTLWLAGIAAAFALMAYGFHVYAWHVFVDQTGQRLMAIAVTAADDFDPEDLDKLHWARDMKTDAYQRVFKTLNEIRNKNPEVTYAYILRPVDDNGMFEFLADADANYNLPVYSTDDINRVVLSAADENIYPGYQYMDQSGIFQGALKKPIFGLGGPDKWGSFVAGACPIYNKFGKITAILAVDVNF